MKIQTQLTFMGSGKWSDRFGGLDQPYLFADFHDRETNQLFTWSVPEDSVFPPDYTPCEVVAKMEKQAKPGAAKISKGDRAGEAIDFVRESLKVKVLSIKPVGAVASQKPASATKAA